MDETLYHACITAAVLYGRVFNHLLSPFPVLSCNFVKIKNSCWLRLVPNSTACIVDIPLVNFFLNFLAHELGLQSMHKIKQNCNKIFAWKGTKFNVKRRNILDA
jgi:hypothetical protein